MNPLAEARASLGPVTVQGTTAEASVILDAQAEIFAGHFPGQPLLPGVAAVGLLIATFEAAIGRRARVVAVHRCKWNSPGFPGDRLDIRITWQVQDGTALVKGTVTIRGTVGCEAQFELTAPAG